MLRLFQIGDTVLEPPASHVFNHVAFEVSNLVGMNVLDRLDRLILIVAAALLDIKGTLHFGAVELRVANETGLVRSAVAV